MTEPLSPPPPVTPQGIRTAEVKDSHASHLHSTRSLTWAGTHHRLWLPESPSLIDRTLLWRTAQISVHLPAFEPVAGPTSFHRHSARFPTGCNGNRCAPASGPPSYTTSIFRRLDARTVSGRFRCVHARTFVRRTLLPKTSRLSLGWASRVRLCPSAYSRSTCCTCPLPIVPLPLTLNRNVPTEAFRPWYKKESSSICGHVATHSW